VPPNPKATDAALPTAGKRSRLLIGGALTAAIAAVLTLVATILPGTASAATTICSSQTGNSNGYYYSFWTAGGGSACMTLGSGGDYSTSWSNVNNFVAGTVGVPADG